MTTERTDAASMDSERRLLFAAVRGGMLRLVHRPTGWWLEMADRDRLMKLSVSDDEAASLTAAMEEAGIRV